MPNAKDYTTSGKPKFLVLGKTGSGKTSQLLTIPGRKFTYCFDSNSIETLKGQDIEYEEFLPDNLSLKITSLSKETTKKLPPGQRPTSEAGADLYNKWEANFDQRVGDGFFDNIDVIGMDSFTTLSDMVMDRVLAINGRAGQWPQMDDYGPQMLILTNIVRTLTSMNKIIYFTGHVETVKDELTSRILNQPLMTGRLKSKLPLLFSEILVCEATTDAKGTTSYVVQTRPDRYNESVRCTVRGAELKENINIDWTKPVVGQGLAKLYKLT